MLPTVQALFARVIDYAGLFPPARLPLNEALRNYDRYRQGAEPWLLGRFVCPAARLPELIPFADEVFPLERPLALTVLGSGDPARDQQAISELHKRFCGRIDIGSYECKSTELDAIDSLDVPVFVEPAPGADWRAVVAEAARRHQTATTFGFKLRCGGETAAAFPTSQQVAQILVACREADIPIKFTAGLHHPLRYLDPALGVKQHGFLNVFAAGILAHARRLTELDILRIIEEEDAKSFHFAGELLSWRRQWSASAREIVAARDCVTSFGSCSFEEPVAGLREMRLLETMNDE